MEFDNEGNLDFQAWFYLNKKNFPPGLEVILENGYDSFFFLFNVYRRTMDQMAPAMRQLMTRQYPVFTTEKRPLVKEFIDIIATTIGYSLLFRLKNLVDDQKKGVKIREKYAYWEEMIAFYARPHEAPVVDQNKRPKYRWLNDEKWKSLVEMENTKMLALFNWKQSRKFEFIDIVQTIVLENFKELEDLNPDEWIVYAAYMSDEYEYYQTSCDNVELFIDCGFQEEEIKLSDAEFRRKYANLSPDVKDKLATLRNRRISGEAI